MVWRNIYSRMSEIGSSAVSAKALSPHCAINHFTATARTLEARVPAPQLRCQQGIHVLGRQTKHGGHPRQTHVLPRREVGRQRRRDQ